VLAEDVRVVTAAEFVECSNKFANKVHVHEITEENIASNSEVLNIRWEEKNVKKIAGTMKFHSFKCTGTHGSIQAAITSLDHEAKLFKLI
jgi:hypothetical protein